MKRYIFFFLLVVFGQTLYAQEEYIRSFHSDLQVNASGMLTVTETIEIYAAGEQIRRGIVRTLPLSGTDYRYKTVKTDYKVIHVKMNGGDSPYDTEKKQGNLFINVGDDSFLEPGWYTFQIKYTAEGQLGYFEDYDELYWNVNGFGWDFRIASISAAVQIPQEAEFLQSSCYTGYSGSTEQNCNTETLPDGRMIFRAENLASGQNLTIATGFTKGIVSLPPPPTFFEQFGLLIFTGIMTLVLLVYYIYTWQKYGVDPPSPTVIPEFNPPSDLSPASVGMLHKGYFWGELISASIVHLAVNGYLRIEEKSKDQLFGLFKSTEFHLVKLKEEDNALPQEERKLMQYFFTNGNVAVIDGKYSSHFKSMYQAYMNSLVTEHKPFLTQGSNWKFWVGPVFIFIIYALVASRFDYNYYGPPTTLDFNIGDLPILPLAIFFVVFISISLIKKRGTNWLFFSLIGMLFLGGSFYLFSNSAISLNNFILIVFIVFAVISFFTYIYLIRQPSEEKLDLRARIDGFKRYLSAAEERQLQMFNPPKLTPEVFEKLLPYAMAFKVDKIWGEKFQTLMERASLQNQHRTSWYSGSRAYSYGALGNHINRSLTNSINSSSGTNSGGSGSSGGGSSGGGRGGGGGGGR